ADAVDLGDLLDRAGEVEGEDPRAVGREPGDGGGSETGGAAGDDGGGVVQLHGSGSFAGGRGGRTVVSARSRSGDVPQGETPSRGSRPTGRSWSAQVAAHTASARVPVVE